MLYLTKMLFEKLRDPEAVPGLASTIDFRLSTICRRSALTLALDGSHGSNRALGGIRQIAADTDRCCAAMAGRVRRFAGHAAQLSQGSGAALGVGNARNG